MNNNNQNQNPPQPTSFKDYNQVTEDGQGGFKLCKIDDPECESCE